MVPWKFSDVLFPDSHHAFVYFSWHNNCVANTTTNSINLKLRGVAESLPNKQLKGNIITHCHQGGYLCLIQFNILLALELGITFFLH